MSTSLTRILVPADFGDESRAAADYVGNLATRVGARVHLLHVLDRLLSPEMAWATPSRVAADLYERLHHISRQSLREAAAVLQARGVPATFEVREGSPGPAIVSAATDAGCDLIVLAVRDRSPVQRMVTGSVTAYVVRHAPCAVLVLPAPVDARVATEPEHRTAQDAAAEARTAV